MRASSIWLRRVADAAERAAWSKQRPPAPAGGPPPLGGLVIRVPGVLYDASAWPRWLFRLLRRMGLCVEYASFFRVWERDYLPDVHRGRREYWEAMRALLADVGLSRGQLDEVEAAGRAQRRRLEDDIRPLPGVRRAVAALTWRGVRLTAWAGAGVPPPLARRRLDRLGLASFFAAALCQTDWSDDADALPLEQARTLLALPADRTAWVSCDGDELRQAAAAGWRTVAAHCGPEARADRYIEQLDELLLEQPGDRPWRPDAAA